MIHYTYLQYFNALIFHNTHVFIFTTSYQIAHLRYMIKKFICLTILRQDRERFKQSDIEAGARATALAGVSPGLYTYMTATRFCEYLKVNKDQMRLILGMFTGAQNVIYLFRKDDLEWAKSVTSVKLGLISSSAT